MAATNVSRYVFRFLLMSLVALGLAVGFTGSSPAGPRDGIEGNGREVGERPFLKPGQGHPASSRSSRPLPSMPTGQART